MTILTHLYTILSLLSLNALKHDLLICRYAYNELDRTPEEAGGRQQYNKPSRKGMPGKQAPSRRDQDMPGSMRQQLGAVFEGYV